MRKEFNHVQNEHAACGVGVIVSLTGESSHDILKMGVEALSTVEHRVGRAPDATMGEDHTLIGTSDGVGLIAAIPQVILKNSYETKGHPDTLGNRDLGLGVVFLPRDSELKRARCQEIIKEELIKAGFEDTDEIQQCRWRDTPVRADHLGPIGRNSHPRLGHLMIPHKFGQSKDDFNKQLFVLQRKIENRIRAENLTGEGRNQFYIASMSAYTVVYKSLSLAHRFADLYPDLKNPKFKTPFAGFHGRYATNTAPAWWRAHFKRILAHNGEINTLRANVNAMPKLERIFGAAFGKDADDVLHGLLNTAGSDTDILDNAAQFLYEAGVSLPLVKSILIPPSVRNGMELVEHEQELYRFITTLSPGWEGPGMFIMADGKMITVGGDLNGMRPTPYEIFSKEGEPDTREILVAGSERGMVHSLPYRRLMVSDEVQPGYMIGANFTRGLTIADEEVPFGFLSNEQMKNIAVRQAQKIFNYQRTAPKIITMPIAQNTAADFDLGVRYG